jgi:hypothetical protein
MRSGQRASGDCEKGEELTSVRRRPTKPRGYKLSSDCFVAVAPDKRLDPER